MSVHAVLTHSRSGDLKDAATAGSACSGPHSVGWADARAEYRISAVIVVGLKQRGSKRPISTLEVMTKKEFLGLTIEMIVDIGGMK
jgi:hypothetical protein